MADCLRYPDDDLQERRMNKVRTQLMLCGGTGCHASDVGAFQQALEKELEKARKERGKTQEGNEESVDKAIRKAKEAREVIKRDEDKKNAAMKRQQQENKTEEKGQKQGDDKSHESIEAIIRSIHSHIDSDDKQGLMSSYSKLQSIYKNASKEDKIKIIEIDNRDRAQTWEIAGFISPKIFFSRENNQAYILSLNNLFTSIPLE